MKLFKKRILSVLIPILLVSTAAYCYTRDWSVSSPIDHSKNSTWPAEIRKVRVDIADRLDDIMNGFTAGDTTTDFNVVPMAVRGSSPSATANQAKFFVKDVSAKAEIFFIDEDGDEQQLTSGGKFIGGMSGEIRMWSGAIAAIPTGWELSDGTCTNSCPDLTNRFIVGANADDGGVAKSTITGSALASYSQIAVTSAAHTLIIAEIPAHTHGIKRKLNGAVSTADTFLHGDTDTDDGPGVTKTTGGGGAHSHAVGSGNHIPTFYALCYIIKI